MVRRLSRADLRQAVAAMVPAFWDYPETVHLLPRERDRHHVLPRYLLSDLRDGARYQLALGADDDGVIVGAAAWIPPHAYPIPVRRQAAQALDLLPCLPWGWRAAREGRRGQMANRANHRVHPPHYYLRSIGVHPDAHGRGVGSSLVQPVLELADHDGVGCFLQTATIENVGWYQRFGFEVAASYRPTPSWPQNWTMWRAPRTGS